MKYALITPAGPGLDVVYGFSGWGGYGTRVICLMREPGKLEPIYSTDNQQTFGQGCFDGRHAWVPLGGSRFRLLRVDPGDGSVKEFNSTNGIPENRRARVMGVPLGIGRVLWIGFFGRTDDGTTVQYLMTETSASNETAIRIIHEKPYQRPGDDSPSWKTKSPSITYDAMFALPLRNAEADAIDQLLIGRRIGVSGRSSCLLFGLDDYAATTVGARVDSVSGLGNYQVHNDAVYWNSRRNLWRVTSANLDDVEPLVSMPDRGAFFFAGDQVVLIGEKCWIADDVFSDFRELPANIDPIDNLYSVSLHKSAHYGRLVKVMRRSAGSEYYRITFVRDGDAVKLATDTRITGACHHNKRSLRRLATANGVIFGRRCKSRCRIPLIISPAQ